MKKKSGKKKVGIVLGVFILVVAIVAVSIKVSFIKSDQVYQEAFSKLQKKFSNYVVENYKGVRKIEWNGLEIHRFETGTEIPLGYSEVKIYVTDEQALSVNFDLYNLAKFDKDSKQFIFDADDVSPAGFDHLIETELQYELTPGEKRLFEAFQKDPSGSPEAPIKYNISIIN